MSTEFDIEALAPKCADSLSRTKVAVIGGGLAGLMAARVLCRFGAKVTVYEARAQVGGRVLSDYSNFAKGRITEFGAELVGSVHPMWCGLAKEYGISLISRMSTDLYRGQGLGERLILNKTLPADLEAEVYKVLRRIAEVAEKEIRDPSRPWDQPGLVQLDQMSVAAALRGFGVPPNGPVWAALELLLVNNNVAPLERMNYLGLLCLVRGGQLGLKPSERSPTIGESLMGYWDELEIYRCGEGCQRLALELEAEINRAKGCRVVRRRAVTRVDLSSKLGRAFVTSRHTGDRLIDRQIREKEPVIPIPFDYVVLAVPPSVWADIEITPRHPKDVIGLMQAGAAAKFFSNVKGRFWIKPGVSPLGGSHKIGQVWEGTDNQTRVKGQDTVLSVFVGARIPTEDEFRRGLAELYPDYPKNVTKTRLVDWTRQPFIKAGYSAPGLGQIFTVGKELNEPFRGWLFFAGEHTQLDHFGYMEGALRSGYRAAHMLVAQVCSPPFTHVASTSRQGKNQVRTPA